MTGSCPGIRFYEKLPGTWPGRRECGIRLYEVARDMTGGIRLYEKLPGT